MDPTQHSLNSNFQIDQIIGIIDSRQSGEITVAAGSSTTKVIPITTFAKQCLFEGFFNVRSVGSDTPLGSISFTGAGVTPIDRGVAVRAYTSPGSITLIASNSSLSSQIVDYRIALIASTEQDPVAPPQLETPISFSSDFNYLKIAKQGIIPVTVPAGYTRITESINHALNYNPFFKVWYEYQNQIQRSGGSTIPGLSIGVTPKVTPQDLFFDIWNATGQPSKDIRIHYRVYYDY